MADIEYHKNVLKDALRVAVNRFTILIEIASNIWTELLWDKLGRIKVNIVQSIAQNQNKQKFMWREDS